MPEAATVSIPEPQRETYVDDEGDIVDALTGEILGSVKPPPFQANTRAGADWVLSKLAAAEAQRVAIARRRAILNANLDSQDKVFASKIKWLTQRFEPELRAFAEAELEGKKARTLTLDHGKLSFATSKGTNEILDMTLAVGFLRRHGFGAAVKVEERVTVTDVVNTLTQIEDGANDEQLHQLASEAAAFLKSSGPSTKFKIVTGIGKE